MVFLIVAVLVLVASGSLAALARKNPRVATALGAGGAVIGCALALVPAVHSLTGAAELVFSLRWNVPLGAIRLRLDALSAFFLVPVAVLGAAAAAYGASYMCQPATRRSAGSSWLAYNLLLSGMMGVLVSRNAVLFLVAWEIMSLSAWLLVTIDHEESEVRRAGWIYLVAAHIGTAALVALFLLFSLHTGSSNFDGVLHVRDPASAHLLFFLALIGFGVKAGLVPLHVWLPGAHAAAPSHVSALMSGVMIKMGIYGVLRVVSLIGAPRPGWGILLSLLGLSSALYGISLALCQRDLKRSLAYSSIENSGLVMFALGLGLWGWSSGNTGLATLGMVGGLLHVWNHAAMKGLMFLCAGSVLHGTGTRDLERMGGLLKRMPVTGAMIFLGGIALSALPPLNGFTSKWLMYLAAVRAGFDFAGTQSVVSLMMAGALALIGALAGFCFLRIIGIALLGEPRSEAARNAHESSRLLVAPLCLLAVLCVAIAVAPAVATNAAERAVRSVAAEASTRVLAPVDLAGRSVSAIGRINSSVMLSIAGLAAGMVLVMRRRTAGKGPTWGCGYPAPNARMQYTSRSFSQLVTSHLLPGFLASRISVRRPQGFLPAPARFDAHDQDPFTGKVYEPFFASWADRFFRIRWLQQGRLNVYLLYIFAMVLLGLAGATFLSLGVAR